MRRPRLDRVPVVFAVVMLAALSLAAAQDRRLPSSPAPVVNARRVALVIGNDAYPAMPLRNAVNDARLLAGSLRDIGFTVQLQENLGRRAPARAVDGFVASLTPGDVALFYYAGHAAQEEGKNYLIPIDLDPGASREDLPYEAYAAQQALDKMRGSSAGTRLMVLDACRSRWGRSVSGGLAKMSPARGEYIVFSTAENAVAEDNPTARNSLFTANLAEALKEPGLRVQDVFKKVQVAVDQGSSGRQTPPAYDMILGDLVLNVNVTVTVSSQPAPAAAPAPVQALPKPVGDTQLDLSDLAKRAEAEKAWADYQSKMTVAFQSAEQFERGTASSELKATAWERFGTA